MAQSRRGRAEGNPAKQFFVPTLQCDIATATLAFAEVGG